MYNPFPELILWEIRIFGYQLIRAGSVQRGHVTNFRVPFQIGGLLCGRFREIRIFGDQPIRGPDPSGDRRPDVRKWVYRNKIRELPLELLHLNCTSTVNIIFFKVAISVHSVPPIRPKKLDAAYKHSQIFLT